MDYERGPASLASGVTKLVVMMAGYQSAAASAALPGAFGWLRKESPLLSFHYHYHYHYHD